MASSELEEELFLHAYSKAEKNALALRTAFRPHDALELARNAYRNCEVFFAVVQGLRREHDQYFIIRGQEILDRYMQDPDAPQPIINAIFCPDEEGLPLLQEFIQSTRH